MGELNYLQYSDSLEQIQPDEAELTELIVCLDGASKPEDLRQVPSRRTGRACKESRDPEG